ncbi:MAG: hypothetical protein LBS57_08265 [Treponema sp.]|jgi:rare lipoprotein A|nr:hypothetical protein [Treponema sp.]
MKRLSAVLVIGLFSVYCFAQTQTGNASYNASKNGFTLAHPSMSFGTRVRITNLRNNREVIASVDGRIPVSDPRVADISAEAGDAIEMSRSGLTEVRLEQILPEYAAAPAPAPEKAPVPENAPAPEKAPPVRQDPPPSNPSNAGREPRIETIQIVSPQQQTPPSAQYLVLPSPAVQNCSVSPVCVAILILLIIAVLLLAVILVLLLRARRIPWWPWYRSAWVRRHLRYLRKGPY